jgi:DNA-binding response OmpR family regulator
MPDPNRPRARVLLVEDDLTLSGIVARHLTARGHEVRAAESAEVASEIVRTGWTPTVVLLDINLPGESGWSLLRGNSLGPAGSVPVYIVSATAVPPARLREFQIAGFLPKPFAMPVLVEVVERSCGCPEPGRAYEGGIDAL